MAGSCLRFHATPPTFLIWNNLCDLIYKPLIRTYTGVWLRQSRDYHVYIPNNYRPRPVSAPKTPLRCRTVIYTPLCRLPVQYILTCEWRSADRKWRRVARDQRYPPQLFSRDSRRWRHVDVTRCHVTQAGCRFRQCACLSAWRHFRFRTLYAPTYIELFVTGNAIANNGRKVILSTR